MGVGITLKNFSQRFIFYVMGKSLSEELSFTQTGLVYQCHVILMVCFRDVTLPESRPKSPRKFFPTSPLNIVKKPEIFTNKRTEPKKDDLLRMATMPKESRPNSSKLLPVITRQKKSKSYPVTSYSQSYPSDSAPANQHSDVSANNKGGVDSAANQKWKKIEGLKQDRKESVEGTNKYFVTDKVLCYFNDNSFIQQSLIMSVILQWL